MKNIHTIVLYVALAVLAFFLLRQCEQTAELKDEKESVTEFLNDSIEYYKNELGQEIAHKRVLQGNKNTLEILLSEKNDTLGQLRKLVREFRRINVAGNISTETRIDTIRIPYEVEVPVDFVRNFEKVDDHYTISGISTNHGLSINSLSVPNTMSFAIGDKKIGLFRSEYKIEVVNSNPYVTTTGLDTYTLKTSKGILSVDAQAGYGLTAHGPSPYVGVGIGMDLWESLKALLGIP